MPIPPAPKQYSSVLPDGTVDPTALRNNIESLFIYVQRLNRLGSLVNGTYTPVASDLVNIATLTPNFAHYVQVENLIFVSGQLALQPISAATLSSFRLELPTVPGTTNTSSISGIGISNDGLQILAITGDSFHNSALFTFTSVGLASLSVSYNFTYPIL